MRLSTEGRTSKFTNLKEQLDVAAYGTLDRINGLEVVSKLLSHALIEADSTDKQNLDSTELHSLSELFRSSLHSIYTDVSEAHQAIVHNAEIEKMLIKSKPSELFSSYTRREPTAYEENKRDEEFFNSYFNK